jgi:hypothetical protein
MCPLVDRRLRATFTAISSITIESVVGTPTAFIRWGSNGLAFTTRIGQPTDFSGIGPGQLYVVSGSFVKSSKSANEHGSATPLLSVKRTWNVNSLASYLSEGKVVRRSPFLR